MLHLARLRLLSELSVLGTISAVADTVHLTRPAVSQQLNLLEKELNVSLFERNGRHISLTPAALRLVQRSRELFQLVNDIESEIAAAHEQVFGEVRISAFTSILIGLMPTVIRTLDDEYPQLRVTLTEHGTFEGLRALASNQLDVAIAHDMHEEIEQYLPDLDVVPFCTDYLCLVMSSQHKLAGKTTLRLSDLGGERWICDVLSPGYLRELKKVFAMAGYTPDIRYSCVNPLSTLELIRKNNALTLLSAMSLRSHRNDPDFAFARTDPPIVRQIFIAVRKGTAKKPSMAAVLDALARSLPQDTPDADFCQK